jgi:hypothetical protein
MATLDVSIGRDYEPDNDATTVSQQRLSSKGGTQALRDLNEIVVVEDEDAGWDEVSENGLISFQSTTTRFVGHQDGGKENEEAAQRRYREMPRSRDPARGSHLKRGRVLRGSLTLEMAEVMRSVADDQMGPAWEDPDGFNLEKSIRRVQHEGLQIKEEDEAAEGRQNTCLRMVSTFLRRMVSWLNGFDASTFDDGDAYEQHIKRLSMAETRAMTVNMGGLLIGVLSVCAAIFTGAMYLALQTVQGIYIPFAYAFVMSCILLSLRILHRKNLSSRVTVFQAYLTALAVSLVVLPSAVHVSVGGVKYGCANGVFGWSILGPVVLISCGASVHLRRALEISSENPAPRGVRACACACDVVCLHVASNARLRACSRVSVCVPSPIVLSPSSPPALPFPHPLTLPLLLLALPHSLSNHACTVPHSARKTAMRWSNKASGTEFYVGLLGRFVIFGLVLW